MVRKREGKHNIYKPQGGGKVDIFISDEMRHNGTEVVKVHIYNPKTKRWRRVAAVPTFRLRQVIIRKEERGVVLNDTTISI